MESFVTQNRQKMQRTMGNFPCRANSGCGPIVHWLESYFEDRTQTVKVKLHYAYKVRNTGRVRPILRYCVV